MMLLNWARQWLDPDSAIFGFRFAVAVVLTWVLSQLFDSDSTGTAMMTTAIIQITGTRGASIRKAMARLAGTFMGGAYVLLIASVTLIDAWLFNSFIILGIVVSLGIASYFHHRVSYMFAIVGVTLSLVGFPVAADPNMANLFDHVQLRCVGISFGIVMSMVASLMIPYPDDKRELTFVKKQTIHFIKTLFQSDASSVTKSIRIFLTMIGRKWLAVDDEIFGSQSDMAAKISSRTSFYDCINIAIMGIELRNMGDSAGMTQDAWQALQENDFILEASFAQEWSLTESDFFSLFHFQVKQFSAQLNNFSQQNGLVKTSETQFVDKISDFTDGYLVLINMFRAALALFLLSFMWIELQWQDGMGAMIMAGMVVSVFAANPGAEKAFSPNIYAQFLAGGFAFLVNFIVMPIGSPIIVYTVGFVGIYIMAYWFNQSKSLLKIIMMVSLFSWSNLVPTTSIPTFDFAHFLNTLVANMVGLIVLWLSYQLIPSRTAVDIVKRRVEQLVRKVKYKHKSAINQLNLNNLFLSFYPHVLGENEDDTVFRLLYTKSIVRVLANEMLDSVERDVLLSSLDSDKEQLLKNQALQKLVSSRVRDQAQLNYNWFALMKLCNSKP
ncbi:FUSC family protein [Vibrio lentus]